MNWPLKPCSVVEVAGNMSLQADQAQSLVEGVSWAGSFPMLRGGVVTFSLKPTQPFCISVRAEPSFAAEGGAFSTADIPPQGSSHLSLGSQASNEE